MIPMLATAALVQGITVIRMTDPEVADVTAQAIVRLPKLTDAERLCIKVAWSSILEGSEEYGAHTLRAYLQQAGKPIVARAFGDHLLLRVTFPKNQFSTAASMMDSLLRRPLLEAAALDKAIAQIKQPPEQIWAAVLEPESWRDAKPSRNEILSVYRKLVRPDNVVLAFGGAIEEAQVIAAVKRFEDWTPTVPRTTVRPWAATVSPLLKSPTGVGSVEMSGPELSASDASFPTHLLAASMLGVGTDSSLFRVTREANAWSYSQEGFLYPTTEGFRLRLVFLHSGQPNVMETVEPFRSGLLAEVKSWDQADRGRALANLRNWLQHGIGISPIWLAPEGRIIHSSDERTHLTAWWRMKFRADLAPDRLLSVLEKVSLDELRDLATQTLEKASIRVLIPAP